MTRTAARSRWRYLVSATGIGLALLAAPSAAFAADDPVTGAAVSTVTADPGAATDTGPVLLLLVAVTIGFLGVLSGPEADLPDRRPEVRPRAATH